MIKIRKTHNIVGTKKISEKKNIVVVWDSEKPKHRNFIINAILFQTAKFRLTKKKKEKNKRFIVFCVYVMYKFFLHSDSDVYLFFFFFFFFHLTCKLCKK